MPDYLPHPAWSTADPASPWMAPEPHRTKAAASRDIATVHEAVAGVQQALLWGLDVESCRSLALDALMEATDSHWAALPLANVFASDAPVGFCRELARNDSRDEANGRPVCLEVTAELRRRAAVHAETLDVDWVLIAPMPGGDGRAVAILGRTGPAFDDQMGTFLSPLLGLLGHLDTWSREIERRQRMERELEDERRRLSLALSASEIGVFELDALTRTLQWDARLWSMHGLEPHDEWSLSDWLMLLHPEDATRAVQDVTSALEHVHALQTQYRIVRPDGEIRHLRAHAQVFEQNGQRRMVGVHIDVTADVRLQHELAAERAQAEAATRAKSEFLATMSHEIRTPMNGVLGMLELLRQDQLTAEQQDRVATALASAETLLRILDDILDLSKLERHQVSIETIPFEPRRLIAQTLALMEPRAVAKGLEVRQDLAPDLPAWLSGDPMRLRQVLLNLLGNAIKFTAAGSVGIRASIVTRESGPRMLRIEISDTGEGIAPEAQVRLFQRFVQADSTTTRRFGGTGLGLAISRQLVELMDGDIGLHSTLGEGSTFWFEVPAVETSPAATSGEGVRAVDAADGVTPLRVLAVDDNAVNRRLAQAFLAKLGHEAIIAESGSAALSVLASRPVDLVLMDVQMPEMDGVSCLRAIRELPPPTRHVPVIALTANAMPGDRERYLAIGFNDYVTKPMTLASLTAALERARR